MNRMSRFRSILTGTVAFAMVLGLPNTEFASARPGSEGFHGGGAGVSGGGFHGGGVSTGGVHQHPVRGGFGPVRGGIGPVKGGSGPVKGGIGPVKGGSGPVKGGSGPVKGGSDPVKGNPPPVGPNRPVPVAPGKGHDRPKPGQKPTILKGSEVGRHHIQAPKRPGGKHNNAFHFHGYAHFWWGPEYLGPFFQDPLAWDWDLGYPYPYLFPDFYPGDYLYWPPCGVWVIQTWFSGALVNGYWDPYLGGYFTYNVDWGYVNITSTDEDVCLAASSSQSQE